jgi:flagellar secretion chaperone FliS
MTRNRTELTYLRAGVQSASSVQLVIVLYDLLIGALMGAITALEKNNIEERSRELKRAFLVLEHMENALDMEAGGEAAKNLARFYATLRSSLIQAHAQASRAGIEKQIQLLFQVRGAWAQVDAKASSSVSQQSSSNNRQETETEKHLAANWTA